MKYCQLGSSELLVSEICLGTMTYGEQNSAAEARSQLDYAVSRGVNFIDTAETIIGATTMEQLKQNIDSAEVALNADVLREIEAIHARYPNPAP